MFQSNPQSLFSNSQTNQQTGSLFGGNQGGSIFGSINNGTTMQTPNKPGGLFGQPQQNTFQQTNLFGQPNISQGTTNLFGGNNTMGGNVNNFQTGGFNNMNGMNTINTMNNNLNNNTILQNGSFNLGHILPIKITHDKETYNYMSITSNDQLKSVSFEELRAIDLNLKKSGKTPNQTSTFGMNNGNSIFNSNNNMMTNNNTLLNTGNTNSLFGNMNTNSIGGGLFQSNNNNNNMQGGIFGSNPINTNTNNTGGLFGGTTNNGTGGSLFGNNTTGGSIFGGNNNANKGLFGQQQPQQQGSIFGQNNQSGGLFGNTNNNTINNTNTNSLFGGTNNTNTGGLFGNNNNNMNKPGGLFGGQNLNTGGGLFNNNNNNNQTGGLFGNTQNNGGSLFNNTSTTTNTSSGGLFGNQNNNTNNTGGLFGGTNNQNTGGLFGNANNNNSGGLFGNISNNNNNNNGGLGLFNKPAQQTTSTGLFGNTTNQTNTGGLFGNQQNNTQGGGLFGNTNTNNTSTNTGGLFGNISNNTGSLFNNSTTNTSGGLFANSNNSLFGNNNNKPATGGLFGNQTNSLGLKPADNKPATGGLFSSPSTSGSLFGNTTTSSLFSSTPNSNTQPQNSGSLFNLNSTSQNQNNNQQQNPAGSIIQQPYQSYLPGISVSNNVLEAINMQKSIQNFLNELEDKYEEDNNRSLGMYGNFLNKQFALENESYLYNKNRTPSFFKARPKVVIQKFNRLYGRSLLDSINKSDRFSRNSSLIKSSTMKRELPKKDIATNQFLFQDNLLSIEEKYRSDMKLRTSSARKDSLANIPDNLINSEFLEKERALHDENAINGSTNIRMSTKSSIFPLTISLSYDDENIQIEFPSVNQNNTVKSLIDAIEEKIYMRLRTKENNFTIDSISLMIPTGKLIEDRLLKEYPLSSDIPITCYITTTKIDSPKKRRLSISTPDRVAPDDLVPKLTKEGYKTSPDYVLLCRMSSDELRKVENFKIYNKYGEVRFLEKVNLLGMNIDEEISIEEKCIEIKETTKGKGLNVKREIRLNGMIMTNGMRSDPKIIEKNKELLRRKVEELGGEFENYNPENGVLVFKVMN